MRLINLKVSHLFGLNYNVDFDFTENDLIAIVGENGSGKSSIMDSIRFAFFGEASPARAVNIKEYIRKGADEGRVSLEFEDIKGNRHRVQRVLKKNSRGNVSGTALLEDFDNGWHESASTLTEVSFKIASLLLYGEVKEGVSDTDTIKQAAASLDISAFISQGNINRILSVAPAERLKLVSSALNIQDGDALKNKVRDLKKAAEKDTDEARVRVESIAHAIAGIPAPDTLGNKINALKEKIKQDAEIKQFCDESAQIIGEMRRTSASARDIERQKTETEKKLSVLKNRYLLSELHVLLSDLNTKTSAFGSSYASAIAKRKSIAACVSLQTQLRQKLDGLRNKREKIEAKERSLSGYDVILPHMEHISTLALKVSEIKRRLDDLTAKADKDKAELAKCRDQAEKNKAYQAALSVYRSEKKVSDISAEIEKLKLTVRDRFVELLQAFGDNGIVSIAGLKNFDADECLNIIEHSDFGKLSERISQLRNSASELKNDIETLKPTAAKLERYPSDIDAEIVKCADTAKVLEKNTVELEELVRANDTEINILNNSLSTLDSDKASYESLLQQAQAQYGILVLPSKEEILELCKNRKELAGESAKIEKDIEAAYGRLTEIASQISFAQRDADIFDENKEKALTEIKSAAAAAGNSLKECSLTLGTDISETVTSARILRNSELVSRQDLDKIEAGSQYLKKALLEAEEKSGAANNKYDEFKAAHPNMLPDRDMIEDIEAVYSSAQRKSSELDKMLTEEHMESGKLQQQLEQYERLKKSLNKAEEEQKRLAPLAAQVKRLAGLADGANFTRYISDRTMEILLQGVNNKLSEMNAPWSISSDNGVLTVTDGNGASRPVSGMSGGESTLISILLLRQISNFNCLWLDESLTMLDERRLQEVLDTLCKHDGSTQVMVVTHDRDLARTFPTIWQMNAGNRVKEPDKEENKGVQVITAEQLQESDLEI